MKPHSLADILEMLTKQNDTLGRARNAFLGKEAARKHFEAVLIREADGKSHAEKAVNAQATEEWLKFHQELARLEAVFEFQKLKFEILDKEYQAQYLAIKIDAQTIRRQL